MKAYFLQKADECLPPLHRTEIRPDVPETVLCRGESITVDLGNHFVGYLSFRMWFVDQYIDAPVTLTVRFCETLRELDDDFEDYRGSLSASWLQEDTVNVDFPGTVRLPRRYAARYVRITVKHAPKKLSLSEITFTAVTSADDARLLPAPPVTPLFAEIDRVACHTLRNCMQRVFEDGPKRDRRLWIGDLRLEALANYATFRNEALVRRCLYLFAAAERDGGGFLPGYVYENPLYYTGTWYLQDYSLMYVCTLCDYTLATGDREVFGELSPLASSILDSVSALVDPNGIAVGTDVFIDWCEGLEKTAAFHGVYLYTLDLWCHTLDVLGETTRADIYRHRLSSGRTAARRHLYREEALAFLSPYDKEQYSVHATAWLILGGVLIGEEARAVLGRVLACREAVRPFTPYMHHYTVMALLAADMKREAETYVAEIWGGMLKQGADTFFEAFDPTDPDFSPYGDRKVNSMCHAWSCTPTYLIRTYGFGRS